ncbi:DUF1471 domain-containing protein [Cronobacter sakazakii]|uniref:YdgH/BhsA/McbA-like domain containing protein n=1 Tax=Cronobacter sakazakii TaxID=28141 RepID=UPI000CFDD8D9|nr:YdgH/BhsA/McbA-like domain containing protein [Cronobacter sakazakii]EKK5242660.1 DUF1471 domain-containing protein [Cronobacter sakazakii]ELY4530590.1 DUF1471 domain-containing protein [Cronobacter sakazakii]
MKLRTGMLLSVVVGALSFGAMAAQELQKDKVKEMNLTKIGTIVSDKGTAPMDAKAELVKKADEMGGKYYVITSGEKTGKDIHATADVYK